MAGHGYTTLVREGLASRAVSFTQGNNPAAVPHPSPHPHLVSRPSSSRPGVNKGKDPGKECHQPGVRAKLGYCTLKSKQLSMVHTDSWSTNSPRERALSGSQCWWPQLGTPELLFLY